MNTFDNFINLLKQRLNNDLPGLEAQLSMAPITRLEELNRLRETKEPRLSAVLVLFYPDGDKIRLIFIKRPIDDSIHSGQIAFPGGKVEDQDKDLIATALREANEEVNVESTTVKVIGSLTKLHIPPSNFDVFPVVGFSNLRPNFIGNGEVDRILEVDLNDLLNPKTKTTKTINHRLGKLVDVPCYFVDNEIIWGATAMMVGELIEVIRE